MRACWSVKYQLCAVLTLLVSNNVAGQGLLFAADGKAEDNFGYSTAIDGSTLLVGAYKADIHAVKDAGAAYIFVLGETGWQQQAKLVADKTVAGDTLGGNVALRGDVAILGASQSDDKGEDAGAVVVFERIGFSWVQREILTAPDAMAGDAFGQSIALNDDYLVIGAPHDDGLAVDTGGVYIYTRDGSGWRYHSKLTASDGAAGDLFGISVAIDDKTLLVGADLHDSAAENAGAVYAYVLQDNQWQQQAKLVASDAGKTDIFGVRVAISGDSALISARRDDIDGIGMDAGSAYMFVRQGSHWKQQLKLTAPDAAADDRFGRGVALDGDTAIISAMNHDASGSDTGALYVYKKDSGSWRFSAKLVVPAAQAGDQFGWNVALSADIAVMTSPQHQAKALKSGAVYIQSLQGSVLTP